jgi:tetratricopeptide (TPR) repeat protein
MLRIVATKKNIALQTAVRKRFFHPLLWGAAVLAKKTVMYKAAGTYGWPRIYKRLREQTKMHVADRDTRKHVDTLIKQSIRAPTQAYVAIEDTEVHRVLSKIVSTGNTAAQSNLPPFLYTLISTAVEGLLPVKATRDVQKAARVAAINKSSSVRPPPPPPPRTPSSGSTATKRSFSTSSTSSSPMPLNQFAKREVKILLGVAIGTSIGIYIYNKYNEDGINDIPAARYRYNLAHRAVSAKKKGDYYRSIELYEELLEKQRTLARNRRTKQQKERGEQEVAIEEEDAEKMESAFIETLYDTNAAADDDDAATVTTVNVECQILCELGALYTKIKNYKQAVNYYVSASKISTVTARGSINDCIGQVYHDCLNDYDQAERYYLNSLQLLIPLSTGLKLFSTNINDANQPKKELFLSIEDMQQWYSNVKEGVGRGVGGHDFTVEELIRCHLGCGVMYNLASMYCEIGKLKQAEVILKRCLIIGKLLKSFGGNDGVNQISTDNEQKIFQLLDKLIEWR